MKALLLSIKPEYVWKILNGEKKYEYRKRLAKEKVNQIYVYCTAPTMKVVASVQVVNQLSASPAVLWEHTKLTAGISREKYREYFRGKKVAYAYELGEVKIFKDWMNLSDFGICTAPQSYTYIEVDYSSVKVPRSME